MYSTVLEGARKRREDDARINSASSFQAMGPSLTPNVAKLSIFKDQKPLAQRYLGDAPDGGLTEVGDDVGVGLEHRDTVAHLIRQLQQFGS